jgi:hypothetical protein
MGSCSRSVNLGNDTFGFMFISPDRNLLSGRPVPGRDSDTTKEQPLILQAGQELTAELQAVPKQPP